MRRFRWADIPLLLVPGALCVWGAYETSNSNQADVRSSFPLMFLTAFGLYGGAYLLARLIVPFGARVVMMVLLLPLAMLSFLVAGLSLGGGYFIFAFFCAPIWGALFGVGAMPEGARPQSAPVTA